MFLSHKKLFRHEQFDVDKWHEKGLLISWEVIFFYSHK
jgi:hypothetical protein